MNQAEASFVLESLCDIADEALSDKERKFVLSLLDASPSHITEKQALWLSDLEEKYRAYL